MCGRFAQTQPAQRIAEFFGLAEVPALEPRYNIAPTQPVPAIVDKGGDRQFTYFRWGLIPAWAKDYTIGARLINARSETAAEKPSFRNALRRRRCLIVADGFFEWKRTAQGKQPYVFYLPSQTTSPDPSAADSRIPFALAGLWERWESADGDWIRSCTILTTQANDTLRPIHDRMPVILSPEDYAVWLNPQTSEPQIASLMRPFAAAAMTRYPVDPAMNRPQWDHPEILNPFQAG